MDKDDINKLIDERIDAYMRDKQYNFSRIQNHQHNGMDSNQLLQTDIVQGQKFIGGISEDTSETVTLGGIHNPIRISFLGFAANNADGSSATKRAVINGEINFGTCWAVTDLTPPITVSTAGAGVPFVQSSNSLYVDTSDLTKTRVATSDVNFIYAVDNTASVVASANLVSFNNQSGVLTIEFVVGSNWKIQGSLTMT